MLAPGSDKLFAVNAAEKNPVDWIVAIIAIAALIPMFRYWTKRLRGDDNWPTVQGTLFPAGIHHGMSRNPFVWLCQFEYRYVVNGVEYSGKLVIGANDEAQAQQFQKELPGQHVTVRFKPSKPKSGFVSDSLLAGKEIIQSPLALW